MDTISSSHPAAWSLLVPLRRARSTWSLLILLSAGVLALNSGCQRVGAPGGSTSSKAEKARRQAEHLAEAAVVGAAEAYSRSEPQAARGGRLERWWRQTRQTLGWTTEEPPRVPPELFPTPIEPPVVIQPAEHSTGLRPKSPPRPGPPVLIRERVINRVPRPTVDEAEEDALTVAAELLAQRFADMDPPLEHHPTREEVRQEYMRRDSREVIPFRQRLRQNDPRTQQLLPILKFIASPAELEQLVDVEFDVEVTSEQIRHLRSQQRLEFIVPLMLMLMLILSGVSLGLFLEEWSKGYFSLWVVVVLLALLALAAGLWYYA